MSDNAVEVLIPLERSRMLTDGDVYGQCPICDTFVTALDEWHEHCDHYLGSYFLDYPYASFDEFPANIDCIGHSLQQFALCLRALIEPLPPMSGSLSDIPEGAIAEVLLRCFGPGRPAWIGRFIDSTTDVDEWDSDDCDFEVGALMYEVLSRCTSLRVSDLDYHHMAGGSVFALWSERDTAIDELRLEVERFAVEIARCALVLEEAR